jgi:glutathione S-transferase
MRLFTATRATNPRRVEMFLEEKGIHDVEFIQVNLNAGEHKTNEFLARNPLATTPVLELDDGRYLAESLAICTYLEERHPNPNLMGENGEEQAFIEMIDRQVEFHLYGKLANFLRHTHPGLAMLEQPQFPDFGASESNKFKVAAQWLNGRLASHDYVAGDRFTVADITAFCTIEFARLAKFKAAEQGLPHLQAWRDRIAERASAS